MTMKRFDVWKDRGGWAHPMDEVPDGRYVHAEEALATITALEQKIEVLEERIFDMQCATDERDT